MNRFVLTNAQWAKIESLCLGKATDPGRTGGDNRIFLEAVLWIVRTGIPWRDLPPSFGDWNSVFKRFRGWVKVTDALGNLVRFVLLPGQRHDTAGVASLIEDIEFGGLIGDKAFDSNWIIVDMNELGAKIGISQHPRRAKPLDIDMEDYKWRHLIENFFGNSPPAFPTSKVCWNPKPASLKKFKRIAMGSDKTDTSFEAMIYLATAVIHSR